MLTPRTVNFEFLFLFLIQTQIILFGWGGLLAVIVSKPTAFERQCRLIIPATYCRRMPRSCAALVSTTVM